MNLTAQNKEWLAGQYPGLTPNDKGVSGVIEFTATYNKDVNRFLILKEGVYDDVGGLRLSGRFNIRIENRIEAAESQLPALFVDDLEIEPISNRHFGQRDQSACLCSPLNEEKFLAPEFNFELYLEELVIPFLYGQLFYTQNHEWPWAEYSHGGLGLLESYHDFKVIGEINVEKFLNILKLDGNRSYYDMLLATSRPSKQKCPCNSGKKFRDCHLKALHGFIELKQDVIPK